MFDGVEDGFILIWKIQRQCFTLRYSQFLFHVHLVSSLNSVQTKQKNNHIIHGILLIGKIV